MLKNIFHPHMLFHPTTMRQTNVIRGNLFLKIMPSDPSHGYHPLTVTPIIMGGLFLSFISDEI